MRRNLGDKRKEIIQKAIIDITNLYHEAPEGASDPRVEVMKNEHFGFARIIVDQPVRRLWVLDKKTELPPEILGSLTTDFGSSWSDEATCRAFLSQKGFTTAQARLGAKAMARTDPAGSVVCKGSGVEADSTLRSEESVPLPDGYIGMTQDVRAAAVTEASELFLASEITPFCPDAWIDHSKTRVTYEIQLHREFHQYVPPESASAVLADVEALEREIQELLTGSTR